MDVSIDQSIPPKTDEECVPGVDEVNREIVPDLKITIQSQEPLEGTVYGAVEGDGIETELFEVLVVVCAIGSTKQIQSGDRQRLGHV